MDWIERIFHISPDGGSGLLEAAYAAAVGLGVAVAYLWRRGLPSRRRLRAGHGRRGGED